MKIIKTIVFVSKSIIWGGCLGFLVLFFMPNSKLPFNWEVATGMVEYFREHQANGHPASSILTMENLSLAKAVERASPSVVRIKIYRPKRIRSDTRLPPNQKILDVGVGIGSGVILYEQGYIVTNYHVIEGAEGITADFPDGRSRWVEIVGFDRESDLAVLKSDLEGLNPAQLAESSQVEIGDLVVAIGSPFGSAQSVSLGIVSAITYEMPTNRIQTDAAINTGNSGGALINTRGQVVGINQMILSSRGGGQTGINYAIPIDFVKNVAEDIIRFGHVRRNWFGVSAGELSPRDYQVQFPEVEFGTGIAVDSVEENSPAARAGIQQLDLLTHFDGHKIEGLKSFYKMFHSTPLGKTVELNLIRKGEAIKVKVELVEQQQSS